MLAILVTGVPKRFGLIHDGGILWPGRGPLGCCASVPGTEAYIYRHLWYYYVNISIEILCPRSTSLGGWRVDVDYGCGCVLWMWIMDL